MPTRNVVLTERHEKLIAELVGSGEYQNASEILREGLRLVEARRLEHTRKLEALMAAAQVGIDAIDSGAYRDFDNFDDLEKYLTELTDPIIAEAADR